MSRRRRRPARRLYRLRPRAQPSEGRLSEDDQLAEARRVLDALRREVEELSEVVARFRRFVDVPPEFLREQPESAQPPTRARRPTEPPDARG